MTCRGSSIPALPVEQSERPVRRDASSFFSRDSRKSGDWTRIVCGGSHHIGLSADSLDPSQAKEIEVSARSLALAKHAVERSDPISAIALLRQTICAHQLPKLAIRADDAKFHLTGRQLTVQLVQHLRSREVNVRRREKIADDKRDAR